jgi:hypothetical protein
VKSSKKNSCKLLLLCAENPPDARPANAQKTAINETTVQISCQGCVDRSLINGANTRPGFRPVQDHPNQRCVRQTSFDDNPP